MITLLLGGTRSGKSELGERLVASHPGPVLYLATAGVDDADMAARIGHHVARRGPRFTTIEAGADLAAALRDAPAHPTLVDALGPWVAGFVDTDDDAACRAAFDDLCDALTRRPAPTVVVSEEVGLSVHPATRAGRRFTDLLGLANQQVAAVADECWLVVAGRVLPLQSPDVLLKGGPR